LENSPKNDFLKMFLLIFNANFGVSESFKFQKYKSKNV